MSEQRIPSYSKVYALGHKETLTIFDGWVTVEEKIDGSQFSFGVFDGVLLCRSKNQMIHIEAPPDMFKAAVETARELADQLHDGWTYRAEFLAKPKHHTMAYGRIPRKHLIIYDIDVGLQDYLMPITRVTEADRLGLDSTPVIKEGVVKDRGVLDEWLKRESCLGGSEIEGVVIKRYDQFAADKKTLMAKYVSERFKETHQKEWKVENPAAKDILTKLVEQYATPARYQKAVQHLAESGKLKGSLQDIGLLMKEVPKDVLAECEDEIKDALFKFAWPQVKRRLAKGLPQWYKDRLADKAFEGVEDE